MFSWKAADQSKPHSETSRNQLDKLIGGTGEGGQPLSFYRRPSPARKSYWAPLTAQRLISDTVHFIPLNGPHGGAWPHPLLLWWILCRGRRPKTPNSFIKKGRRIRRAMKFSLKTWRRRKDTNFSGAAFPSASSRWFPRRPPVGLLILPQIYLWSCRSPWQGRAGSSLQGLFTRRGRLRRRAHRVFPVVPARTVRSFVRKIRALGSRRLPFLLLLVSPSLCCPLSWSYCLYSSYPLSVIETGLLLA